MQESKPKNTTTNKVMQISGPTDKITNKCNKQTNSTNNFLGPKTKYKHQTDLLSQESYEQMHQRNKKRQNPACMQVDVAIFLGAKIKVKLWVIHQMLEVLKVLVLILVKT